VRREVAAISQPSATGSILICFAVKEEAAPFLRQFRNLPRVQTLITGMGRANALRTLRPKLDESKPALVLSCGFAGGLAPKWRCGDVLFEPETGQFAERLRASAAVPARFLCADRVASTAAEKSAALAATYADAVEMESGHISAECRERGIPCVTVRVVLDTAEEDLPLDFNALMTPDLRLDFWKLAREIARHPGKIRGLLRMQKQSQVAAKRLADVLSRFCRA
jgi:nucleoside phosphorylase